MRSCEEGKKKRNFMLNAINIDFVKRSTIYILYIMLSELRELRLIRKGLVW